MIVDKGQIWEDKETATGSYAVIVPKFEIVIIDIFNGYIYWMYWRVHATIRHGRFSMIERNTIPEFYQQYKFNKENSYDAYYLGMFYDLMDKANFLSKLINFDGVDIC